MFLALLVPVVQGWDQLVTLKCAATPVTQIVQRLAKETGQKIEAPRFENWPVVVSVKDVKLSDLAARIAEVTDSEWVKSGDRRVLTRDAARVRRAIDLEIADRAARLATWMNANLKLQPAQPWSDEQILEIGKKAAADRVKLAKAAGYNGMPEITYYAFADRSPAEILLHDFIRRYGVARLAAAPISGRITFSTEPVGRLKPLPFSMAPALQAYERTRTRFAEIAPDVPATEQAVVTQYDLARKSLGPWKAVFSIFRPQATANVKVQVTVVDVNGSKLLDVAGVTLELSPLLAVEPPEDLKGKVELGDLSRELLEHVGKPVSYSSGMTVRASEHRVYFPPNIPWKVSPELREQLHRPDKFEPMGFFASDWLLGLAGVRHEQLVAYVPEHMFSPLATRLVANLSFSELWKAQPTMGLDLVEKEGWLIAKPRMFSRADRYRVDRAPLTSLLQAFLGGIPTLEQVAAYAVKAPATFYNSNLDMRLVRLLHLGLYENLQSELGQHQLRFYASLTPEQRVGGTFDPQAFSPQQKAALAILQDPSAMYAPGFESKLGMHARDFLQASMLEPSLSLLFFERADQLASEPPVPERIEISRKKVEGVGVLQEDGSIFPMPATSLGVHLGADPSNVTGVTLIKPSAKVRPCFIETVEFIEHYAIGDRRTGVEGFRLAPGAATTVDQLPAALLAAIEVGKKRGAEWQFRVGVGPDSSNKPPPD